MRDIYSFSWPNMLSYSANKSEMVMNKEAIRSNILRLLNTERKTLFGDPFFGTDLKKVLFEQSNPILYDLIIDELYAILQTFIPQIYITRNSIKLTSDELGKLVAEISVTYRLDNTSDLYLINLTEEDFIER